MAERRAVDLPEGTVVIYQDEEWTAYPPSDIGVDVVRWHSETGLASDVGMDGMLADGAVLFSLGIGAARTRSAG